MNTVQTLNEWLREFGYRWVDGKERTNKAMLDRAAAQIQVDQLVLQGVIVRG
jgi:hypothetical protein